MSSIDANEMKRLANQPYPIRVYWEVEDESWVAEVIDLPGCIGVGDSQEEAISVARAFIRDWIDVAVSRGQAIPDPSERPKASGRFLSRVPKSLHEQLQERAIEEGTSLNQLVVMLLSEGLARRKSKEKRAMDGLESYFRDLLRTAVHSDEVSFRSGDYQQYIVGRQHFGRKDIRSPSGPSNQWVIMGESSSLHRSGAETFWIEDNDC